jgi:hypothetical protein
MGGPICADVRPDEHPAEPSDWRIPLDWFCTNRSPARAVAAKPPEIKIHPALPDKTITACVQGQGQNRNSTVVGIDAAGNREIIQRAAVAKPLFVKSVLVNLPEAPRMRPMRRGPIGDRALMAARVPCYRRQVR